jgi:hypothetical protein
MSSATDDEAEINLTRRATLESNSDALQGSQAPPPPVDPERKYDTEDEAPRTAHCSPPPSGARSAPSVANCCSRARRSSSDR